MGLADLPSSDPRPLKQKWEIAPRSVERRARKQAKQAKLDAAYAIVNARDGNRCRVTGERLDPKAVEAKHRREHHHLAGRNVKPEWREDPARICLVSKLAHDLITRGWIDCEGDDATKVLRWHWTPLAKSRPFRIKSRRRSQQKVA